MNPRAIRVFALGVVACVLSSGAFATQILYRSPRQLGTESALVVRGTVSATRSFWNDSHTKILTEVVVRVDETYKGAGGESVRVLQLGGTVDPVKMTVHGALPWRQHEEVLLFLEPYSTGSYQVSGFSQGKFAIERDVASGKAYVRDATPSDSERIGAPAVQANGDDRVSLQQFVDQALGRTGGAR